MTQSARRLSMTLSDPIWSGSTAVRDDALAQKMDTYAQVVSALGGFWDADLSGAMPLGEAMNLWRFGLGWHLVVRNHAGVIIFEGFVNHVEIGIGNLAIERGPLLDVVNYAFLKYQTVSYNTNPPIGGAPAKSPVMQNAGSIARYGRLEEIISGGGEMSSTVATEVITRYVNDRRVAKGNIPGLELGSSPDNAMTAVKIKVMGYVHLLDRYYYINTATGTVTRTAKIQAVVTADPSSRFSPSYVHMDANAATTPAQENGERTAWTIIKEIVSTGDASYNRWLFQVLADRKIHYKQAPSTVEYAYNPYDPAQGIYSDNVQVYRWDVKAGRWLVVEGILSQQTPTDPNDDERALFIEQVKYALPWDVGIQGGKANRLPQLLARYGLGGAG